MVVGCSHRLGLTLLRHVPRRRGAASPALSLRALFPCDVVAPPSSSLDLHLGRQRRRPGAHSLAPPGSSATVGRGPFIVAPAVAAASRRWPPPTPRLPVGYAGLVVVSRVRARSRRPRHLHPQTRRGSNAAPPPRPPTPPSSSAPADRSRRRLQLRRCLAHPCSSPCFSLRHFGGRWWASSPQLVQLLAPSSRPALTSLWGVDRPCVDAARERLDGPFPGGSRWSLLSDGSRWPLLSDGLGSPPSPLAFACRSSSLHIILAPAASPSFWPSSGLRWSTVCCLGVGGLWRKPF